MSGNSERRKYVQFFYDDDPKALQIATAYHEAGHAVVGYRFGKFVRDDGIIATEGNGIVHMRGQILLPLSSIDCPRQKTWMLNTLYTECCELLAGYCAEFRKMGIRNIILDSGDWRRCKDMVNHVMGCDGSYSTYALMCRRRNVQSLVRKPEIWNGITYVAEALLANGGTLDEDEANEALEKSGVMPVSPSYWMKDHGVNW